MKFLRYWKASIRGTGHQCTTPSSDPASALELMDEPFRSALLSMYRNEPQSTADGSLSHIDKDTRISAEQGIWMYELYLRSRPNASLEIGMAYGFSTLFLLAALAKNANGTHTAIDPFQSSSWQGVGIEKVRQVNGAEKFRLIEDFGTNVATDLARRKTRFDFIFIDGNHRYDDVMVDFTLFAPMLNKGEYILLDDMWMSSVRTTVAFVQTNRQDFKQIMSPPNTALFERIGDGVRSWDHFIPFSVAQK
jgi:predicted O-methyltransferase YrrM